MTAKMQRFVDNFKTNFPIILFGSIFMVVFWGGIGCLLTQGAGSEHYAVLCRIFFATFWIPCACTEELTKHLNSNKAERRVESLMTVTMLILLCLGVAFACVFHGASVIGAMIGIVVVLIVLFFAALFAF